MTSRATQLPRRLSRRLVARAVLVGRQRQRRLAPARDERGSAGAETLIMATAALSIVLVVVAGEVVGGARSIEGVVGEASVPAVQAAARATPIRPDERLPT